MRQIIDTSLFGKLAGNQTWTGLNTWSALGTFTGGLISSDTGTNSTRLGSGADAPGTQGVSLGFNAIGAANYDTVVGTNIIGNPGGYADQYNSVFGYGNNLSNYDAVEGYNSIFGPLNIVYGQANTIIGAENAVGLTGAGNGSYGGSVVGVGNNATTLGIGGVIIGAGSLAIGNGIALGYQAIAGSNGIALGQLSNAGTGCVAIGDSVSTFGADQVAIGKYASNYRFAGTFLDTLGLYFGTGHDARTFYDGTDWWFNPREVGTGALKIGNGNVTPNFYNLYSSKHVIYDDFTSAGSIYHDGTDLIIQPQEVGSTAIVQIGPAGTRNVNMDKMALGGSGINTLFWINFVKTTSSGRGALQFDYTYTGSGPQANILSYPSYNGTNNSPLCYAFQSRVRDMSDPSGNGNYAGCDLQFGTPNTQTITQGTKNFFGVRVQHNQGVGTANSGGAIRQYGLSVLGFNTYAGVASQLKYGVYSEEDISTSQNIKVLYDSTATLKGNNYDVYDSATSEMRRYSTNIKTQASAATYHRQMLSTYEANLGSTPVFSGTFDITGLSNLTADKPVMICQAAGPYTGKGDSTTTDESEMDVLIANAYCVDATTIRVYWNANPGTGPVVGNFKFNYIAGI